MGVSSYSSIFTIGHRAVTELFTRGPVHIESKIDGSQISFRVNPEDGELEMRSRGSPINVHAPEGMFAKAVESVKQRLHLLTPGYTYRGEYLAKPKHNTLAYNRTPKDFIIIWDIDTAVQSYRQPAEKRAEAERIGYECVPLLYTGMVTDVLSLRKYLELECVLGGQKIEGVVAKPADYNAFGADKKLLVAKLVSEQFKETHNATWTKEHGTSGQLEFVGQLAQRYATPARWAKARQRLMEAGVLEGSMRDIPKLMAEVPPDVLKECKEEIIEALWGWAWPQLTRKLCKGLPEYYKDRLMREANEALEASAQPAPEEQPQ